MRKTITITLLLLVLSSFTFAQGLGLKSITAKVGVILPEDPWDSGFQFGAKADMGEIAENFHLYPVFEYWSSSLGSLDLTNIQIGAETHYAIENVKGLYVGAGLVLNFVSIDLPSTTVFGTIPSAEDQSQILILA